MNVSRPSRRRACLVSLSTATALLLAHPALAATLYWDGTATGVWTLNTNWSTSPTGTTPDPVAVPGSADDVVFNITSVNTAETITTGATIAANSLTFNNTLATTIQSANSTARTLNLGTGGILLNAGAGAVVIGSTGATIVTTFAGSQTWTNNSSSQLRIVNGTASTAASTLTLAGSGSGNFLFSNSLNETAGSPVSLVVNTTGSGTVSYGGGNYSGGTTIKSGSLSSNSSQFGTGSILLGDTAGSANATLIANSGNTYANNITVQAGSSGNTLTISNNGGTNTPTLSGNLVLNNAVTFNTGTTGTITLTGGLSGSGDITTTASGAGYLAFNRGSFTLANNIAGTGGLMQSGPGVLTLTGATGAATTYTGGTKVTNGGTIQLDFDAAGAPATNIINGSANSSKLFLSGGTLAVKGVNNGGTTNSQRFNNVDFAANTSSALRVTQNGAGTVDVTLGAISARGTGSTADFTLPSSGAISTTSTTFASNGVLVGTATNGIAFATVDGTHWAANTAGAIGALGSYQTTYVAASNVDVGNGVASATDTPASAFTVNTLRFNAADLTLAASGVNTVSTGGILVTSAGTGASITGGSIQAGGGKELVVINHGALNIGSVIQNNATPSALTIAGTGTTTLTGVNTYTGATAVNSGATLQVGAGGTTGNLSASGAITNNGTLVFNRSDALTVSNVISGTGGINQIGAGTTSLSGGSATATAGTNSYTGTTTLTAGTLRGREISTSVNDAFNAFGTGGLVLNGGTLLLRANGGAASGRTIAGTNAVTIGNSAVAIDVDRDASGFSSNSIGFSGALSLGSGQVNVTGANGYFLRFSGATTLTANATLNPTTANLSLAGVIGESGGSRSITKTGSGTLNISGVNTYTGGTNINEGTLAVFNAAALGSAGSVSFGGGTLQYGGITTDLSNRFSTAAGQAYKIDTNGQAVTFATALTSSGGSLTKNGTGTLTLSSAATYSGPTTVNAGTLSLSAVNALNSGSTVNVTGTLALSATTGVNYGGGQINLNNGGTLNYSINANGSATTQKIAVAAGATSSLNFTATTATRAYGFAQNGLELGSAGTGATLNHTLSATSAATSSAASVVTLLGDSTVNTTTAGAGVAVNYAKGITESGGSYGFTKGGAGVLILGATTTTPALTGAASTYTGTTTVSAGTLRIGVADSLPDTALAVNTGATFDMSLPSATGITGNATFNQRVAGLNDGTGGGGTIVGNSINTANGGNIADRTLTLDGTAGTFAYSGIIIDKTVGNATANNKLSLAKSGASTQTLSGANTYTGATTVSGGTLRIAGSGTINTSSGVTVTGGTFDYQNNTTGLTRNVTVNGGTFKNNSSQDYTGTLTFTSGTVGGTNLSGVALTVGSGRTLSPGNSPGTLSTGALTWTDGGHYNWQIADATGAAGTGFDTIAISSGGLNLSGLTTGGFNINLWSLSGTGPDVNGDAANFDHTVNQSWTLVSNTGDLTSLVGSVFSVNVAANNGTGGFSNNLGGGAFSVVGTSNSLDLVFTAGTIPEPASFALLAGASALLTLCGRRRRSA